MIQRQLRRTRIIGTVLLGALTSVLLLYVIGPRFAEPTAIRVQAAQTLQSADAVLARLGELEKRAKNLESEKAALAAFEKKFPSTAATPELQQAIYKAASTSGLGIKQVVGISAAEPTPRGGAAPATTTTTSDTAQPAPGTPAPGALWQMNVSIDAVGSMATLGKFISQLYYMERTFVVDKVTITLNEGGELQAKIAGRAFLMAPTQPAAAATPAATQPPVDPVG